VYSYAPPAIPECPRLSSTAAHVPIIQLGRRHMPRPETGAVAARDQSRRARIFDVDRSRWRPAEAVVIAPRLDGRAAHGHAAASRPVLGGVEKEPAAAGARLTWAGERLDGLSTIRQRMISAPASPTAIARAMRRSELLRRQSDAARSASRASRSMSGRVAPIPPCEHDLPDRINRTALLS
jgi:hypothetical protein